MVIGGTEADLLGSADPVVPLSNEKCSFDGDRHAAGGKLRVGNRAAAPVMPSYLPVPPITPQGLPAALSDHHCHLSPSLSVASHEPAACALLGSLPTTIVPQQS